MDNFRMPLIGEKAPDFKANTTNGPVNFPTDYKGKWVVFFSHPGDFTPVCTTEMMTFASMKDQFAAKNASLLGLSVDSNPSHIAWVKAMENYKWKGINNPQVNFPIIADDFGNVARMYGMLMPSASATKTVRNVYIVDPTGTVRAILIYPLTTGRNLNEVYRLLLALQAYDENGYATPADWQPGDDQLYSVPQTTTMSTQRMNDQRSGNYNCLDWYLCFTRPGNNSVMKPAADANMQNGMQNMPTMPMMMNMPNMQGMPAMPNMPSMPAMPNMPSMPTMPNMPSMPAMPNMSSMPAMPNMSSMPAMPSMSSMPTMPSMSSMPTMPNMSSMPAMPNMPSMPAMPNMSDMSMMPNMQDISAIPNMPTTSNMQMTAPAANSKMPPETATMTTPVSTSQAAQRAALNMNKQATTPPAMVYEAQQPGRPFAPENAKTGAGTSSIKAPISGGSIMDENRNLMGLNKNSKSTGSLGDYFKSRDNRSK